jgi:glutaredoxin
MKTLILSLLLFLSIQSNAIYNIVVYGTSTCGYTTDLRNKLTQENITFTFCDINNTECYNDFVKVVADFKLAKDNYVDLPVVKVVIDNNSYGFVRPSIVTIKQLISLSSVEDVMVIIGARFIDVYDMSGSRVLHSDNKYINTHSLSSGCYIIRINGKTIMKFVKQ